MRIDLPEVVTSADIAEAAALAARLARAIRDRRSRRHKADRLAGQFFTTFAPRVTKAEAVNST